MLYAKFYNSRTTFKITPCVSQKANSAGEGGPQMVLGVESFYLCYIGPHAIITPHLSIQKSYSSGGSFILMESYSFVIWEPIENFQTLGQSL